MAYIIGDIGGTSMRVGVANDKTSIQASETVPTPTDFADGMKTFINIAKKLVENNSIEGVALGVPGPLNKAKSSIINAPNLSGWNNQPLKETLEKELQASVTVENDAALAGLGEAVFGTGKDHSIVAYLGIGTGIGGVRIVNKTIDVSAQGFEPGHQIVEKNGRTCGCGGIGHLEAYASGTGIKNRYAVAPEDIQDDAIWQEITDYLAIGISNTIVFWSPDIVVLGGSVSRHFSLENLTHAIQNLRPIFPTVPPIVKKNLEDASGLQGALALLS